MNDEIAAPGWLKCERHCMLNSDRRVKDCAWAMKSTRVRWRRPVREPDVEK